MRPRQHRGILSSTAAGGRSTTSALSKNKGTGIASHRRPPSIEKTSLYSHPIGYCSLEEEEEEEEEVPLAGEETTEQEEEEGEEVLLYEQPTLSSSSDEDLQFAATSQRLAAYGYSAGAAPVVVTTTTTNTTTGSSSSSTDSSTTNGSSTNNKKKKASHRTTVGTTATAPVVTPSNRNSSSAGGSAGGEWPSVPSLANPFFSFGRKSSSSVTTATTSTTTTTAASTVASKSTKTKANSILGIRPNPSVSERADVVLEEEDYEDDEDIVDDYDVYNKATGSARSRRLGIQRVNYGARPLDHHASPLSTSSSLSSSAVSPLSHSSTLTTTPYASTGTRRLRSSPRRIVGEATIFEDQVVTATPTPLERSSSSPAAPSTTKTNISHVLTPSPVASAGGSPEEKKNDDVVVTALPATTFTNGGHRNNPSSNSLSNKKNFNQAHRFQNEGRGQQQQPTVRGHEVKKGGGIFLPRESAPVPSGPALSSSSSTNKLRNEAREEKAPIRPTIGGSKLELQNEERALAVSAIKNSTTTVSGVTKTGTQPVPASKADGMPNEVMLRSSASVSSAISADGTRGTNGGSLEGGGKSQSFKKVRIKESKILWTKSDSKNLSKKSGSSSSSRSISSTHTQEAFNKIYLLLLQPKSKIFELIQLMYLPSETTIGGIINMIPSNATEPALGSQTYTGIIRPKRKAAPFEDLQMYASDHGTEIESGSSAPTAGIAAGEILVAIPLGYSSRHMVSLSKQILANPRIQKLLDRSTPSDNDSNSSGRHQKSRRKSRQSSSSSSLSKRLGRKTMEAMESVQEETHEQALTGGGHSNNLSHHHLQQQQSHSTEPHREYEEGMKRALEKAAAANAAAAEILPSGNIGMSNPDPLLVGVGNHQIDGGISGLPQPGLLDSFLDHHSVASSVGSRRPIVNGCYDEESSLEGSYLSWSKSVDSSVVNRRKSRERSSSPTSTVSLSLSVGGGGVVRRRYSRARTIANAKRITAAVVTVMALRYYFDPKGFALRHDIDVSHRSFNPPLGLLGTFYMFLSFAILAKLQRYAVMDRPTSKSRCPFLKTSAAAVRRLEQRRQQQNERDHREQQEQNKNARVTNNHNNHQQHQNGQNQQGNNQRQQEQQYYHHRQQQNHQYSNGNHHHHRNSIHQQRIHQ